MRTTTGVDHYNVLGLPSGKEGAKLTLKEITRAFKLKALELHPDKRPPDDPKAKADFQKLGSSYQTLKDPAARRRFDDSLLLRHLNVDAKRMKKAAGEKKDHGADDDVHHIKHIVLEVSWVVVWSDYGEEELREFFSRFGLVQSVCMKGLCFLDMKSAKVSMVAADSAVAVAENAAINLSNPILVSRKTM
ncbi:hypothetical protein Tsubulata_016738 [Turnera subulata]|uniref:J domain-containing protein n=1 Tax=Turnera subulata TaxID=218843 RepID=A0A9Q0GCE8_9ROSI|nr:hypothetical protein Tsubulata_016738 [Turnera subulata]